MPDVWRLLDQMSQPDFFSKDAVKSMGVVHAMAKRWREHFDAGRFKLAMPDDTPLGASAGQASDYWTWPDSFGSMPSHAPDLLRELQKSDLVVFKGDLNYRKLTQDAEWPVGTSFTHALGPLAGQIPLVALRTCKADVCVGLNDEQVTHLSNQDATWRTNGRWAGMLHPLH